MALVSSVTSVLSFLTLIADILIILCIAYHILKRKKSSFLNKSGLLFAFIIALIAITGSLFYSEIAGYTPCNLCWYQRIFMYPMVLILGIALIKKDNQITKYVIPMSIIGAVIAAYHYLTQILNTPTICSATGECASKIFFSYGYITIPMMSLTAFLLIIISVYFQKGNVRRKK